MPNLFDPFTLRSLTFPNRVWVSPMCQYSATDGVPDDWHLVHLGSRAVGRAGLIVAEATAVSPEGRITPQDTGLWNDEQTHAWSRINAFIHAQDGLSGVQLAHAGRKASTLRPWDGNGSVALTDGGWETLAPSAVAFEGYDTPRAMTIDDIQTVKEDFVAAARRAVDAGFDVIELHAAHGYLLHEFLSPLANHREDEYGGSLENRMRLVLEITKAVRVAWPAERPLFVRISATDWVDGGWDLEQSTVLARELKARGVDLIDCSTGGVVAQAHIPVGPGYQVEFARDIREHAGLPTAAVGMITTAEQAQALIANGDADAVFLARAELWDPYWPLHAAHELGVALDPPVQYGRAAPRT